MAPRLISTDVEHLLNHQSNYSGLKLQTHQATVKLRRKLRETRQAELVRYSVRSSA